MIATRRLSSDDHVERASLRRDVSGDPSNAVIGTLPIGSAGRAIDVTPDGSVVYVAVQESGVVAAISTATNAVVGSVPAGTRPLDVRVLPNGGRVYSVSEDRITAISTTTGGTVGTIPITLSRAVDLTRGNTTGIVAADGRVHMRWVPAGTGSTPTG